MAEDCEDQVCIRMVSKRNVRRRRQSSDSSEDEIDTDVTRSTLEDMRELQKLRKRPEGVSAVGLAVGKKVKKEVDGVDEIDPYKLKHGGFIDMKKIKDRNRDRTDEDENRDVTDMGVTFSAETNRRDEDADMQKYIEQQMALRLLGDQTAAEQGEGLPPLDDAMLAVSEHLRASHAKKSEDMLSNQMLSGIPEVDLGIDAKINNIELTELARKKLIEERKKKKEKPSQFVPTNVAVNFVQHKRLHRRSMKEVNLDEQLIVLVQDHPELYDIGSKSYKDVQRRDHVWSEIGEILGKTGRYCKAHWTNLRDSFNKYLKKMKDQKRSGSKATKVREYRYAQQLSFLLPFLQTRPTSSNVTATESSDEEAESVGSTARSVSPSDSSMASATPLPPPLPTTVVDRCETPSPCVSTIVCKTCKRKWADGDVSKIIHFLHQRQEVEEKKKSDIETFFYSMGQTCQKMQPKYQRLFKRKVFDALCAVEDGIEQSSEMTIPHSNFVNPPSAHLLNTPSLPQVLCYQQYTASDEGEYIE
ncbi:PREDICTED: uncharacterized protein LOC106806200 isoform X1 [Priapulus caudatus]|uniref:Uncharacterized protein LOC106806200 isoform X1 n=1 Tax=Priapulus caudatus TaxID=37621 RepID=A0ABM1DUD1_PRICU|nr:PREDICTED: uncharacterized protein LOC106806200 isoform X1 [Priapulus caudatus]